jgi:magnesium-transporting ATPase (P-type)
MTYPSPFDYTLERQILTAMQPGWVYDPATQEGARKFCVENQPEYRYRKCLWVMIIAHFVAFCISTFYTFLSANYREINQEGYDTTKHYRMFVISSVAGFTVCTGLAYWLMTTISFPNANENTACTMENRHSYSIILLWMWADILISYFSIATVFLDYNFGKRQDIYQMQEYIALAKRNAVKKFYATNIPYSDISLKGRLIDEIEKRKKIYDEVVSNPYAESNYPNEEDLQEWEDYKKYRQFERRA